MSELPAYFEHQLERPPEDRFDFYPFSYDDESQAFTVGKTTIQVVDFDPYRFSPGNDLTAPKEETVDLSEVTDNYALLPGFSGVIGCPRLHEWVDEHRDVLGSTRAVMHRAFTALVENPDDIEFIEDERGFMGYAAHIAEHLGEPNSLHLQVIGDCACMGRDLYGLFIKGMDNGFAQYDLHNADTQAQRAGLYAGIGHLAKLAAEASKE